MSVRRMACYLLRKLLDLPFVEVGRILDRDSSTTMYMFTVFERLMEEDDALKLEVNRIIAELATDPAPVEEEHGAKLSDSPLEGARLARHANEGSMLRGYYLACITEAAIIATLLLCCFAMHPERASSSDVLAAVLSFIVATSLADTGIYFENRGRSWSGSSFGERAVIVLAAIETAFIAVLVSLATMSLLTGLEITANSLLRLSGLAAASLGPVGLICFFFAGRSSGCVDCTSEKQ